MVINRRYRNLKILNTNLENMACVFIFKIILSGFNLGLLSPCYHLIVTKKTHLLLQDVVSL